jgi:cytochrome c peroxidase
MKTKLFLALPLLMLAVVIYFFSAAREPVWQWGLPAHFSEPRVPADNPMSEAKFQLGRALFYDKRVSGNGTLACAGCHLQNLAFSDGKAVATGSTGMHTARSAQGLANVAYYTSYTWANFSLASLERQMLVPMLGEFPVEMGLNDGNIPVMLKRLSDDADYAQRFAQVFPEGKPAISLENVIKAIATFERGLISATSKYDEFLAHHANLNAQEERGRSLFFSAQAQCSQCHSGFNFSDQTTLANDTIFKMPFHNTGLYNLAGTGGFPEGNRGIFELSNKPADMGAFRAPSLRNVAVTEPYMHDGSIASLSEVLKFYAGHGRNISSGTNQGDGRANLFKDERIARIKLDDVEQADVIAFLHTLTDEKFLTNPRFSDPKNVTH